MIVGHIGGGSSAIDTGDIGRSLRFRASNSAYLSIAFPGSTGNTKGTFFCGVKRGSLGTTQNIFNAGNTSGDFTAIFFNAGTNALHVTQYVGSVMSWEVVTSAVFRDPTAHAFLTVGIDSTQAVAADRVKIYLDGARLPVSGTYPALSQNIYLFNGGGGVPHSIGRYPTSGNHLDGYLSRICGVHGVQLDPSSFIYQNTESNAWVTKPQSEVKAVVDAGGTNSFMLDFDDGTSLTTLGYDKSSKGNNWTLNNFSLTDGPNYDWMEDVPGNSYAVLNPLHTGRSTLTNGNLTASGTTDLPTMLPTSETWYFERVGVAQTWTPPAAFPSGAGSYNFGQRPWQGAGPTAGQKTLCQRELETPAILDPSDHHTVLTLTKSGDTNFTLPWNATDYDTLFWIKRRDAAGDWYQIDGLRGYDKILKSNSTAAETTDANVLGVSGTTCTLKSTLPDGVYVVYTWKAGLVAERATNTDGSITSTVSANVTAGFSIVTYTGNLSSVGSASVGHGLSATAVFIVSKSRNSAGSDNGQWVARHKNLSSSAHYLRLNTADASIDSSSNGSISSPTTSIFGTNWTSGINTTSNNYVAYCHAEIPGYSKFGSYTGNGSADGPFVWADGSPMDVLFKRTNTTGDWQMLDAARSPSNLSDARLWANLPTAEMANGVGGVDLVANGFKLRGTVSNDSNANGGTYIYAAYAKSAFKYSNSR